LKRVQKFELRRQGVESQARRQLEYQEFINILTVVRINETFKVMDRYWLCCILSLQWRLIARVDDIMKI
ncbi:TPA: hypothetical protein N0F65_000387, partial [Lagenidium giganteum]